MRKKQINNKISISTISQLLFILTMVASIHACGFLDSTSWKEEVLLHDGSKIIVKRWQQRGGNHEIGQKPSIKEQSITFKLPKTNKNILWRDEYSEEIGRSNFKVLALHILNSTPYIITTPRLCLSFNKWGRPNPPYVVFRFESDTWKRIDLAELPIEFKNINLVIDTESYEEDLRNHGLIDVEMMKKFNRNLNQVEYKTIVRTPIKKIESENCPEVIYYKGSWVGPGNSIGRRMVDKKNTGFPPARE